MGCPDAVNPLKALDEAIASGVALHEFNPFEACGVHRPGGTSADIRDQPAKIAAMMSESLEAVAARRKKASGSGGLGLPMRVPQSQLSNDSDDDEAGSTSRSGARRGLSSDGSVQSQSQSQLGRMPKRPAGIGSLSPVQEAERVSLSAAAAAAAVISDSRMSSAITATSFVAAAAGDGGIQSTKKAGKSVGFALPDYIKDFAPRRKAAAASSGSGHDSEHEARKASAGSSASGPADMMRMGHTGDARAGAGAMPSQGSGDGHRTSNASTGAIHGTAVHRREST